ncbi:MAG: alpha/beta hydrolase [Actinobacteria bacterium]|nr:alpha/beta hydrolase [Actinomycetota bacterium]
MPDPLRGVPFQLAVEDGATLAGEVYEPAGEVDSTLPTIVLAHGWTLNHTLWSRVIRGLHARARVRVVAYDQRGHGHSTSGTGAASIARLGRDLAAVIEATVDTDRVVLGGHSMGGMTIMAYAGQFPDDLAARADRVILLGTAAADVERPGWAGKVEMGVMHIAARGPRIKAGVFVRQGHLRHLNFGDDPDPRDVRLVRKATAGTSIRDMGRYFTALEAHDERASLAVLGRVPTTIVVGELDRLTPPRYGRALHDGIPGSRLIELSGKGHMLGFEATDLVVDLLLGAD